MSETEQPSARVAVEGDGAYVTIDRVAEMEPFLVSVVSSTDLWMFVASNGGLTAGRVDPKGAIFPYETVDRLYERPGRGGSWTAIRVGRDRPWQPMGPLPGAAPLERRMSKSGLGDEVVFEERSPGGALVYRLRYRPSDCFGWVREVELENTGAAALELDVLDGLLDILPAGVETTSQQRASNLVDAYRHSELDPARRDLALYGLSSLLTDRAEPSEALRVNTVWRLGPPGEVHLSPRSVRRWWRDALGEAATHLRGQKGAYLHRHRSTLAAGERVRWRMVLDSHLDHLRLAELSTQLGGDDVEARLDADLEGTRARLIELVGSVDGWQRSQDRVVDLNHLSNTVFNGLRGGFLLDEGRIPKSEVAEVAAIRHRDLVERHRTWLLALPERLSPAELRARAEAAGDPQLQRLADEVLPLAFGRRHGDPSRPWNQFSVRTRDASGQPRLAYEGNWRDIFQNWEALAASYPDYLPSFVAKFVSASTVDGFNPYRLSKEGVDWEVPDPDDPWSNIGYWGDHQVIYLLRLLEALDRYRPSLLDEMLDARRFAFSDVPYRLAGFDALLEDPAETIDFDEAHEARIEERVRDVGMDGRLVHVGDEVALTHLWEKLLITFGAKVSNLVLDGGIWMNTQRPEWNDANNALPGLGASVVTLAHTLRYTSFLLRLARRRSGALELSTRVSAWLEAIAAPMRAAAARDGASTPADRRAALEAWGRAYSDYRAAAYQGWSEQTATLELEALIALLDDAERVLRRSFIANRRADGLFHAYNTIELEQDAIHIHHLPPMLEGQVAALDAQVLAPDESAALVDAMFDSPLYRADQQSFLLYPDKTLPDFEARNRVPETPALALRCVKRWLEADDRRVIARDADGVLRFEASLRNAKALAETLERMIAGGELEIEAEERRALLELYEATFGHRSFTGRSQGMYGFEGLGCIYWHMVAKLLVAVGEVHGRADATARPSLAERYHRVRRGFNFNKSPEVYGAFPTDAYSHTPGHSGAQQPGMTGQVKEQVLTRWRELGVELRDGRLGFRPALLNPDERLSAATPWVIPGHDEALEIPAGGVGFFYAGVPVALAPSDGNPYVTCFLASGEAKRFEGDELDEATTRAWLERNGAIVRAEVRVGGATWPR